MTPATSVFACTSWAACVSAALGPYGAGWSPGLCLVMASGLWLSRELVEDFTGPTGGLRVRLLNPMATEYLSAALQVPLVSLRRAEASQWYWLASRARTQKLTLIKLGGVPVAGATPAAAEPVFALVRAVEPAGATGAGPGAPPPPGLRVQLDFGDGLCPWTAIEELLPFWIAPTDRDLAADSYALLPPRLREPQAPPDWRGALTRQTALLGDRGTRGLGALSAWRAEMRSAAGATAPGAGWGGALLAALGCEGAGSGRTLFARGLEDLRTCAGAELDEAIAGWHAAAGAWRRAAARLGQAPQPGRAEFLELLDDLATHEAHALAGLRLALREAA